MVLKYLGVLFLILIVRFGKSQNCYDSNGRVGTCMILASCPHLLEQFYEEARRFPASVDFQTFVSRSLCGFDGFNFLICCTSRQQSLWYGNYISPPQPAQSQQPSQPPSIFHFASLTDQVDTTLPPATAPPMRPSRPSRPTSRPGPPPPAPPTPTKATPTPPILIINPVPVMPSAKIPIPLPNPTAPPASNSGECGISTGPTNRVVGGLETKRGNYPWIAALGYYEPPDPTVPKFYCGGSLISSTYVITSAHCIIPTLTLVRLGAHDLSKTEAGAIDVKIKRKVVHEKFDLKTISNDIALLQLNDAVSFTEFIRPICLPEDGKFMQQDFVGSNPFVAGWGTVQYQGTTSNVLRDAQVPVIATKTCVDNYTAVFKTTEVSSTLICAGNARYDACQGDSGGPLMMPQLEGKTFRYFLIGLVSYGYECARAGFPGVYTRVAAYMQWIQNNMS